MKLIVGLGNPGKKYVRTPHNLGYRAVGMLANQTNTKWQNFSRLSKIAQLKNQTAILLRPLTFMNLSGQSVKEVATYFKIKPADIWLVHDELDLPAGKIKLSFAASSAGHRGVQSVIDELGTNDFWRWRLGIGRPPRGSQTESFVLSQPQGELKLSLNKVLLQTVKLLKIALTQDLEKARQLISSINYL